jgi:hypothetical protein
MSIIDTASMMIASLLLSIFFWTLVFKQTTKTNRAFMARFFVSHAIATGIMSIVVFGPLCLADLMPDLVFSVSLKVCLQGLSAVFILSPLLGLVGIGWEQVRRKRSSVIGN